MRQPPLHPDVMFTSFPHNPWPKDHRFALFLSHDIDQIDDRELFRVLGDLNHIRRMLLQGEKGNIALALRRVMRSLFHPKPTGSDIARILEIEARYGFHSTFYVLHDPYWSRMGPRYKLSSKGIHNIVDKIREADGEIGVHGGYLRFNNADLYRESREVIDRTFDVQSVGIRNHYLRFSYPETWRAQVKAGFLYDATFGDSDTLGPKDGQMFPFYPIDPDTGKAMKILALPITVMDATLFRYMKLSGQKALDAAWAAIQPVIDAGGMVSLLWHNNYFDESEYWDWQWVYEQLLERLAALNPWCATGEEIARWVHKQNNVECPW